MFSTLGKLIGMMALFALAASGVVFYFTTLRPAYDLPTVAELVVPPLPPAPADLKTGEGPDYRELLARAVAHDKGLNWGDAERVYRQALLECEKRYGENSAAVLDVLVPLADLYAKDWRYPEAGEAYIRVFTLRQSILGPAKALKDESAQKLNRIAEVAATRAKTFTGKGSHAEAEPLLRTVAAIRAKLAPPDYDGLVAALDLLDENLVEQNKYEEAGKVALTLLQYQLKMYGDLDPRLVKSYFHLGLSHSVAGRHVEAEADFRKAATIEAKAYRESPVLGTLLTWVGDSLMGQSKFVEAEAPLLRGLQIREKRLPANHPKIAESFSALAALELRLGRYGEAELHFRRALAIWNAPEGAESLEVVEAINGLGVTLHESGRFAEAEPLLRRALQGFERHLPDSLEVTRALFNLVYVLHAEGRLDEAATLGERQIRILETSFGPDHPRTARGIEALAMVTADRADIARAEALYTRSLKIFRRGDDPLAVAGASFRLAQLYASQGKFEEAAGLAVEGSGIRSRLLGAEDPKGIENLEDQAELKILFDQLPEAEATLRQALDLAEKSAGPDSIPAARLLMRLGEVSRLAGRPGAEEELYRRPLSILRRVLGNRHPSVAMALERLGSMHVAAGRVEEALKAYDEAEGILAAAMGKDAPNLAGILNDKGLLFLQMKRMGEAEALFRRSIDLAEAGTKAETPRLATLLGNLAEVYQGTGRSREAKDARERSDRIFTRLYGARRPPAFQYPTLPVWVREM